MSDTLRSIAEGMEHSSTCLTHPVDFEQAAQGENCPKCRLEALLAEYEKADEAIERIKAEARLEEAKWWIDHLESNGDEVAIMYFTQIPVSVMF